DGIRDFHVTGVQTCALPIWEEGTESPHGTLVLQAPRLGPYCYEGRGAGGRRRVGERVGPPPTGIGNGRTAEELVGDLFGRTDLQIGRASCRERVEGTVGERA